MYERTMEARFSVGIRETVVATTCCAGVLAPLLVGNLAAMLLPVPALLASIGASAYWRLRRLRPCRAAATGRIGTSKEDTR